MSFSPIKAYNDLPLLPPRVELETRAVLKLCIEARAQLAELKQLGDGLPNPAVLINAVPLLEAQASLEIENIVTTTDRLLRDKLANWEAFLHAQEDIDPLVRMAVGHYQFEAIHPFTDGNGRTGRVLNLLYLVERGLLSQPTLYLSGHINRTRHDYYRLLLDVTTSERWEDWILYMLKAIRETAAWTSSKIRATQTLL